MCVQRGPGIQLIIPYSSLRPTEMRTSKPDLAAKGATLLKEAQLGPRMRVHQVSKLANWVVRVLKEQTPTICTVKRVLVLEMVIRRTVLVACLN